jgi:hypothetical protein
MPDIDVIDIAEALQQNESWLFEGAEHGGVALDSYSEIGRGPGI